MGGGGPDWVRSKAVIRESFASFARHWSTRRIDIVRPSRPVVSRAGFEPPLIGLTIRARGLSWFGGTEVDGW